MANETLKADEYGEIVEIGRVALAHADPAPAFVANIAKMAFDFREVPTVESVDSGAFAGVRSTDTTEAHRVDSGDSSLLWARDENFLSGLVDTLDSADAVNLTLQTMEEKRGVDVDQIGTFELPTPQGAYRFIVEHKNETWATTWHN